MAHGALSRRDFLMQVGTGEQCVNRTEDKSPCVFKIREWGLSSWSFRWRGRRGRYYNQYLFRGTCSCVIWIRLSSNLAKMPTNPQSRLVLKESLASWESPFQSAKQHRRRHGSDCIGMKAFSTGKRSMCS